MVFPHDPNGPGHPIIRNTESGNLPSRTLSPPSVTSSLLATASTLQWPIPSHMFPGWLLFPETSCLRQCPDLAPALDPQSNRFHLEPSHWFLWLTMFQPELGPTCQAFPTSCPFLPVPVIRSHQVSKPLPSQSRKYVPCKRTWPEVGATMLPTSCNCQLHLGKWECVQLASRKCEQWDVQAGASATLWLSWCGADQAGFWEAISQFPAAVSLTTHSAPSHS